MMKIKTLIEKLKDFPEDYEICPCKCGEEMIIFDSNGHQKTKIKI